MENYIIILESENSYQPISEVCSLQEAHEAIRDDYAMRLKDMDAHLAPESYALWSRGFGGAFVNQIRIGVDTL
jgi:hypothetical protein